MWRVFDRVWHGVIGVPYRLVCEEQGSKGAGRDIVLLHGLASSKSLWRPLTKLLGDAWHVLVPDLLGFGDSPAPTWSTYDVDEHTRHVVSLMKRRGLKHATVVGHSMGCLVAVHLATKYPKLVRKLVLYEPPLFADVPDFAAHQRARQRYFAFFSFVLQHPELLFRQTGEVRQTVTKLVGFNMTPETRIPFMRSLDKTIMQQRTFDELHQIRIPTVIVHGRVDFVVTRADVREMLQANRHISFQIITQPHGLNTFAAKQLVKLL